MSYLRLLTLLYIADRESIKETRRPIVGGRIVAMDHGPVLNEVHDIIKNMHANPGRWPRFIRSDHIDVVLDADPGVGDLSRFDVAKLQQVRARYENRTEWDIVENVVRQFDEYKKNTPRAGSVVPIPYRDIMIGVGMTEEESDNALKEAYEQQKLDQMWTQLLAHEAGLLNDCI